jgi:hypothetical protein
MASSGNGDSTHQKVSKYGAIRLVFDELGDHAPAESVRQRVAERFGYTIDDRDIERIRLFRSDP